ncbi:hypothetical protein MJH12_08725 [bacterium]|nr:hypothetical protein [bacterium]
MKRSWIILFVSLFLVHVVESLEVYDTDFGEVKLKVDGDMVYGYYHPHKNGAFLLNDKGNDRYSGYWVKDLSDVSCKSAKEGKNGKYSHYWGRLELIAYDDGNEFRGHWSYCGASPQYTWNGKIRSNTNHSHKQTSTWNQKVEEVWNTTWGPLKIFASDSPNYWVGHYKGNSRYGKYNKTIAMEKTSTGGWEGRWVRQCVAREKRCSSKWAAPDGRSGFCWGGVFGRQTIKGFTGFYTECGSRRRGTSQGGDWNGTKR